MFKKYCIRFLYHRNVFLIHILSDEVIMKSLYGIECHGTINYNNKKKSMKEFSAK